MLPEDTDKFRPTSADHIKGSFFEKQNYLILHAKQIKQSAKKAAKTAQQNLRNIRKFFNPRRTGRTTTHQSNISEDTHTESNDSEPTNT